MLSIIQTANQSGCISLRQRRHNQSDHSKLRRRFLRLLKTLVVSLVSAPFAESCGVLKSQVSIFFSFFFSCGFNLVWCICSSACLSPSVCILPLLLCVYWPLLSVSLLICLVVLLPLLPSVRLQFTFYICTIQSHTFSFVHVSHKPTPTLSPGMNQNAGLSCRSCVDLPVCVRNCVFVYVHVCIRC